MRRHSSGGIIPYDTSACYLPLGAAGEAAIYTHHFRELSLLREILLRMRSWQNHIFFEAL